MNLHKTILASLVFCQGKSLQCQKNDNFPVAIGRIATMSNFSNVQFALKKGGTISYDVVTGPCQYSRNLEKLLRDQQRSYLSANLALSSQFSYTRKGSSK